MDLDRYTGHEFSFYVVLLAILLQTRKDFEYHDNRLYCNCIKGLSIFFVVVAFSKGDPSSLLRLQSTAGC